MDDAQRVEDFELELEQEYRVHWNKILRAAVHDPFFSRLSLYPFLRKFLVTKDQHIHNSKANRLVWLEGKAIPLQPGSKAPIILDGFINGRRLSMNFLWQLGISSLLILDLIRYGVNVNLQSTSSVAQVLFGFADRNNFISTALGIASSNKFLSGLGIGLLLGVPLLLGAVNASYRLLYVHSSPVETYEKLSQRLQNSKQFIPRRLIEAALHHLTWTEMSDEASNLLWTVVLQAIQKKYRFSTAKYNEFAAAYLDKRNAEIFNARGILDESTSLIQRIDTSTERDISLVLKTLIQHSNFQPDMSVRSQLYSVIQANYLLWKMGCFPTQYHSDMTESERNHRIVKQYIFFSLFEIAKQGFLLFGRFHYWRVIVELFLGLFQSSTPLQELECENPSEVRFFRSETASDECGICSDWPFVYISDIDSAQNCYDGALSAPLSAAMVRNLTDTLLQRSANISSVDFSQQAWDQWNDQDWSEIFRLFDKYQVKPASINLSAEQQGSVGVSNTKIRTLANFFDGKSVSVSLQNQPFNNTACDEFFGALSFARTPITINVANCELGDECASGLANMIDKATADELDISGNLFSEKGWGKIASAFSKSQLSSVKLGGNAISQNGLNAIGNGVRNSTIKNLSMSNSDLSNVLDYSAFANGLASLDSIDLTSCNLNDIALPVLIPALKNMNSINLSGNSFSDEGNDYLFQNMMVSNVTVFIYNNAGMSDTSLQALGKAISDGWDVEELDISSNSFKSTTFETFCDQLKKSHVKNFKSADNFLDHNAVVAFSDIVSESKLSDLVDLSGNTIDDSAGNQLINALRQKQTKMVFLARNALASNALSAAVDLIRNNVTVLDLTDNGITAIEAQRIFDAIPGRNIRELILDHNPIGDGPVVKLASEMIEPNVDAQGLDRPTISRNTTQTIKRANPSSALTKLSLKSTNISDRSVYAQCHTLFRTKVKLKNLKLGDNPSINGDNVNIRTCQFYNVSDSTSFRSNPQRFMHQISSGSNVNRNHAALGLVVPIFGIIVLLYLLYKTIPPFVHKVQSCFSDELEKPKSNEYKTKPGF